MSTGKIQAPRERRAGSDSTDRFADRGNHDLWSIQVDVVSCTRDQLIPAATRPARLFLMQRLRHGQDPIALSLRQLHHRELRCRLSDRRGQHDQGPVAE
jgi:hypothetical protein